MTCVHLPLEVDAAMRQNGSFFNSFIVYATFNFIRRRAGGEVIHLFVAVICRAKCVRVRIVRFPLFWLVVSSVTPRGPKKEPEVWK